MEDPNPSTKLREFSLREYKPINYTDWKVGDEARKGINIKHLTLLNPKELAVWNAAIPYQDQRKDPGQGEIVTYFALQLLNHLEGNRDIVVPAAILHDTGWYGQEVNWQKLSASGDTEGEARRRPHQNRGVGIAGWILGKEGYSVDECLPIFDIIGDHDTRFLAPTPKNEAQIVRDADCLWRVTYPCIEAYMKNDSAEQVLSRIEKTALNLSHQHKLGPLAEKIARIELANTMVHKFPTEARRILKGKYAAELEKVFEFYDDPM